MYMVMGKEKPGIRSVRGFKLGGDQAYYPSVD
jgi:hypothetical protein